MSALVSGEQAIHQMTFYQTCIEAARKDPTKSLQCKIVEPAPVYLRENHFILKSASHPYAALLFIEHMASPEGQKIIDEYEPIKSSIFGDGEVARVAKGKKMGAIFL
jgi:ABC-type Fe3+ transport system substrate-binding protein